jgi:hypothetical protein
VQKRKPFITFSELVNPAIYSDEIIFSLVKLP